MDGDRSSFLCARYTQSPIICAAVSDSVRGCTTGGFTTEWPMPLPAGLSLRKHMLLFKPISCPVLYS
ncbi:TPA: hypothetical protein N0F65_001864 [Lagenidium giganteum]|uniref:Uncharacterized protein n=1 Tax=Lagenidium giganteum TaxID=4803 RepID=A0AAV2YKK6_9STRA|nr:TPA: hypothetical protein N0F65_001864 [Lagenidium giganteum]